MEQAETSCYDKDDWLESIEYIYATYGEAGLREVLVGVHDHIRKLGLSVGASVLNTDYINTIPQDEEPKYPGDVSLEERVENLVRWNAMAMVLQAQDTGSGVGGHIATFASAATMLEVGFNHFFRARSELYEGDMVLPQPHAAPGVYARAFLEGRLNEHQLRSYRRELGKGGGLCSYPHPRSMPRFWQMPNASMGLSVPAAIYQARFAKYLENRDLKRCKGGKIWCFIGDGETDEPEVLGTINIAAREKLDNLIVAVNCNLQRLDGPVRGNGKIIQELERVFFAAGWHVIKVIWGSAWDHLLEEDSDGELRRRMEACLDGDYQRYSTLSGAAQRKHWVGESLRLQELMSPLTDEEIKSIKRGGQDRAKIYAAFERALGVVGKPVAILVKTVKGDRLGESSAGRNTSHQRKNFTREERIELARAYGIPIDDDAAAGARFYRPPDDSEEMRYLQDCRRRLGGYLPERHVSCNPMDPPDQAVFEEMHQGSGDRQVSTTMVMVRILAKLLRDKQWGPYVVPIVPDEARTFGLDALFRAAGIYAPEGQKYTPVDAGTLMQYREARDGQILQEGICETGAMASFMAAGSAYATYGLPIIPFYFFYSMFGFQRVGDSIWSCGDSMCRGFLLGGTAGRTTLNGEGLQHQDGHSHVLASSVPNLVSYDPAFGYEVALIVRDGMRRMYQNREDVFFYLTVYNQRMQMPAMPGGRDVAEGVLKGGYCYLRSKREGGDIINLLASGALMAEALRAGEDLEALGYRVNIWSITSYVELQRDGLACERWNRLHPEKTPKIPFVRRLFDGEGEIFVAVSDFMKALAEGICRWIPGHYEVLGTDGYGLSESREDARRHFEVSAQWIIHGAISALCRTGCIDCAQVAELCQRMNLDIEKPDAATYRTVGTRQP